MTTRQCGDRVLDLRGGSALGDGDEMRALREIVRVTRPGERVVVIAYGGPATGSEPLQFVFAAVLAVAAGFERLPEVPPLFASGMSDPQELRRRLVDVGLKDVIVDTTQRERIEVSSGDQLWDWCVEDDRLPRIFVEGLSEQEQRTVRQVLDGMVCERSNGNGRTVLTAPLNIGTGIK